MRPSTNKLVKSSTGLLKPNSSIARPSIKRPQYLYGQRTYLSDLVGIEPGPLADDVNKLFTTGSGRDDFGRPVVSPIGVDALTFLPSLS